MKVRKKKNERKSEKGEKNRVAAAEREREIDEVWKKVASEEI